MKSLCLVLCGVGGVLGGRIEHEAAAEPWVLVAAADGRVEAAGTAADPLSFDAALLRMSTRLQQQGLPEGGCRLIVRGGRYPIQVPWVLGPEFVGTARSPIEIRAAEGEDVFFDGGFRIDATAFQAVQDLDDRKRLATAVVDRVRVTTLSDPALIRALSTRVVTTLAVDGGIYLPAVFPNTGYASFGDSMVVAEVSPPAIRPGSEGYGIRAGHPPFQEEGRAQGWLGSIDGPRGAWAQIKRRGDEMAGTWEQWEAELTRNPKRCQLTGYIDANWLLKSQAVVGASAENEAMHLSQALAYGWQWKQNDKPFRVFGLLCELDQPGEWHFDTLERQLYLLPPGNLKANTRIHLPVAEGFLKLDRTRHVSVIGLNVENLGGGFAYRIEGGEHNLVAGAKIRNSAAGGVWVGGRNNRVQSCDLVDLEHHVRLGGGRRGPGLLEAGANSVVNCHIYQKGFAHRKVSISISGVGNHLLNNLVHNSIGQAVVVSGNDHLLEWNEFFNIGFDEGDGGAVYSGADLIGYGNTYRHNFFHHLMHVPGKVERSGIHLDDCQAGATCVGNVFYKSAAKGIFMFGGAGHTLTDNVFLEGFRGIYNVGTLGARHYQWEQEIAADPEHNYRNTKENYLGRVERVIGPEGWLREPWRSRFPLMVQVMSDRGKFGRMWPIRCQIENNLFYGHSQGDRTIWSRMDPEVTAKSILRGDRVIRPEVFVDYAAMDFRIRPEAEGIPTIPFENIGLTLDPYRQQVPDKAHYRQAMRDFYDGISSMPGTHKRIDSALLLEGTPWTGAPISD